MTPTTPRLAQLPAAVLGNGSLLLTLSARGEVERVFWPSVDRAQDLGELRFGLADGAATVWVSDEPFTHRQAYADDAMILRTTACVADLSVEIEDHVAPDAPVLVRRIVADRDVRVDVVPRSAVSREAAREVVVAQADGATTVVIGFGRSREAALELARRYACVPYDELTAARRRHDWSNVRGAAPPDPAADGLAALYRRSLLVFDLVTDRETGGVLAAPELDAERVHSGGYGFVWPRDLAFCVLAFLATGRADPARSALRWSVRAQSEDGKWLQRHWTDASPAPSWTPLQLDETGAVLHAYEAAWRALGDRELDAALWPAARRAADFLVSFRDATGLPLPSFDLWEELEGQHAYTAASVVAALRAAASMAARHEPARAAPYREAAGEVAAALDAEHWDERAGHYVSTLGERHLDASLLGLAWPFRAVDPGSPRMRATAAAVERELTTTSGGLVRYRGDVYAGGNAWVLTTLWLGLWYRQVGETAGFARCLAFASRAQTGLGLLPEQVADDGRPAWVVPLTWSHAMLTLAMRPEPPT